MQALNDFKAGRVRVLAATDIAARGIDISELPFVFNYNLPDVPETYVHRIGRTGRAGHEGEAISFCQFDEKDELKAIEKLLGRPIPVVEGHPYPMENFDPPQKDKHGRPVNSEDAEARAAAKERRRQRDAENKARAEERKKAAAGEEKPTLLGMAEAEPAAGDGADGSKKKKRRRKKSGGAAPEAPAAPAQEAEKPLVLRDKPIGRGVRQGRIADTLPDDPSMPVTEFHKPNPLDSDVIMDATARLLAPRRPAPRPQIQPQGQGRDQHKAESQRRQERAFKPAPQKPRRQGKKQGAPAQPAKEPVLPPSLSGKKRRRRDDRPRPIEAPLRSDRQKDSTQHKSLMRPYYLHDGD